MKCDYCNKEIKEGFLGEDFYTLCLECILKLYTEDELNEGIKNGLIFFNVFDKGGENHDR